MFWNIELLYFVIMIAAFIVLLLFAKLPTGLCLMISAVLGFVLSAIISNTSWDIRYLVEGMFGYLDTILIITTAMVFMGALQACGTLEYVSTLLVKALGRMPSLLLIALMIIVMFPAMVTGSSLASAISAGALVAPIMMKWGIPKHKTAAFIGIGSILGMVAPPVNVPAMVICDVVDIPFTGFTTPLLLLAIPLALVSAILLCRKYVKPIAKDKVEYVVDVSVLKELNWTVCLPLFVLILFIIAEMIFPLIFGSLGMSAMFVISTIVSFFVGRKRPFWKKKDKTQTDLNTVDKNASSPLAKKDGAPDSIVEVIRQGVYRSLSAMGLLAGVGMFMEVIALNGVRGFIVYTAISLPDLTLGSLTVPNFWQYVGMAVSLPVFGGISAFGSASMLGGPFVMALNGICYDIMVTGGLSLLAALGEFLPPSAMSAMFATTIVGEKGWAKTTKAGLPALAVIFVYTLLYILMLARWVQASTAKTMLIWIYLAVTIAIAIVFIVVWEVLVRKVGHFKKYAHEVVATETACAETAADGTTVCEVSVEETPVCETVTEAPEAETPEAEEPAATEAAAENLTDGKEEE